MTALAFRSQQFPDYLELPEPQLRFDPYDPAALEPHPLKGLLSFGPYSEAIFESMPPAIRLAAVVPEGEGAKVAGLMAELDRRRKATERPFYLPDFPGFAPVFRRELAAPDPVVEMPRSLEAAVAGPDPQRALSEAVRAAIEVAVTRRVEWDVLLIYLPARWSAGFEGGANEDFDLHDHIKAVCAARGIPTQVLNDDAFTYACRASVAWRLGIALYVKAGGVPWKMEPVVPDTAFIGLSYSLRTTGGTLRYVTCCSQIFDAEGTGLEFLAYDTRGSVAKVAGKNPFLFRDQMRAVMAQSLALYLERHAGHIPRRMVIHKSTEWKGYEIDGAFDALGRVPEIELLTVTETDWRAIRLLASAGGTAKSVADNYPLMRGTLVTVGEHELLLYTQGDASAVTGGQRYFPEGRGLPRPLLLRRYAGHSDAALVGAEVLALSKMDWNNDKLYDTLPATQAFAKDLANVVKRIPSLDPRPYALRLFM